MADPAKVAVVNPETGEQMLIDKADVGLERATGGREMTAKEMAALQNQRRNDRDFVGMKAAETVGKVRGIGEAFGVPLDPLAVGIGDALGKGNETRSYLNDLKTNHPWASGIGEVTGQVSGAIGGAELTGGLGGSAATTMGGRIAQGAASTALRGGLENLVIGSTHDVNETSLGNADLAGEKLVAQWPKHFLTGAAAGAVLGTAGSAAGEAWGAIARKAPGMLEHGADAALGRELGGDAALGAEIRGKLGGIPKSAGEVESLLTKEQAAFREGTAKATAAEKDALLGRQTTEAWQQTAKQEAGRVKLSKESQQALDELASQHQAAREALAAQHGEAASNAVKLEAERSAARQQLRNLAGDLDKVKGATMPDAQNVIKAAVTSFQGDGLTPPSPRAVELFQEWVNTFQGRYAKPGDLTFRELQGAIKSLDTMETRQRVVSGWGSDPEVKKAFDALRTSAKAEFDRASEATAGSVSEARNLSAARLRESIPGLDKAHGEALDHVDNVQKAILDFEKKATMEARLAQREAAAQAKAFEKGVRGEDSALSKAQRAEERAVPKASKDTPVDQLLGRVKAKPEQASGLGAMGVGGALLSLLHGNAAGAAMSLMGGFAAQAAKGHGNLLAARTMSALAQHLATTDGQIARLAGRAVGRYARQAAADKADDDTPSRKEPTFEKASKGVKDAQDNPLILEQRVRDQAGPWAQQAPQIYNSMMAAAMRSQAFLESKLPPSRKDPFSLTPHLQPDDLSDTEKYDFVQYAKAVNDPVGVLKDVADGSVTPQQVEALQVCYPQMYEQMKSEVLRHVAGLREPLDYEREVNIGTLLGIDTNETMTGDFQSVLADMYSERAKSEEMPGGGKPKGVNSRLSKSMASTAQQMQQGDE